jgi:D-glycero-D-manno-heptose 1,7-bisphosphate phosphatase
VHKTVFLDRDGVINYLDMGSYVTSWDKFIFLDGVIEAIAELTRAGYLVLIITNQSAINRGLMTEEDLIGIHSNMLVEIENAGGHVEDIYHCPHAPDENCPCRKPNTGMFDRVNQDYDVDYANSWFVGDFESDREVADRMGLRFILAKGDGGLKEAVEKILESSID